MQRVASRRDEGQVSHDQRTPSISSSSVKSMVGVWGVGWMDGWMGGEGGGKEALSAINGVKELGGGGDW